MKRKLSTLKLEVINAALWVMMRSKGKNMKAHVHALMHCEPRIAKMNGFPSLHSSAKECGVSAEYMRRLRNKYRKEFEPIIP